jgi:hypothetical protein
MHKHTQTHTIHIYTYIHTYIHDISVNNLQMTKEKQETEFKHAQRIVGEEKCCVCNECLCVCVCVCVCV